MTGDLETDHLEVHLYGDLLREAAATFLKAQLKNGEFPKIFPFTRFNINRIIGEVEMDPGGQPMLHKNDRGDTVDKQGRLCN